MHGDQECSASTPLHATKHPLTFHITSPIVFPLSEFTFTDFDDFSSPPNQFRFGSYEVQCDLPTKLKPIIRSVMFYLMFFYNCFIWHFLHNVVRKKHDFEQCEFTLTEPRRVPVALCTVASLASLAFPGPPTILANDPLAPPEGHVVAKRGAYHLSF